MMGYSQHRRLGRSPTCWNKRGCRISQDACRAGSRKDSPCVKHSCQQREQRRFLSFPLWARRETNGDAQCLLIEVPWPDTGRDTSCVILSQNKGLI